jgi:hypothetical protein
MENDNRLARKEIRMPKTAKNDAETAYRDRLQDVSALLDWVGEEINMHEDFAAKEGIHWGHVGDMAHYRDQLIQILVALLGNASEKESRRMIEDALAELKM